MIQLLLAVIYLAFISLGLPDSLLGAAWPSIYPELNVPVSYAGAISMTIAAGTIVSSLMSERLTRRFGTGLVTAVSVAMTAAALLGFSISGSFAMLIVFAIPYGIGAGSVDASLNNYVALHYASRHMSWLHCMWGVGASVGPLIMSAALTAGRGWQSGYRAISYIQLGLTLILLISLPLWKRPQSAQEDGAARALSLREIVRIRGAKEVMLCFFCYCALEQTAGLWAGSYLVLTRGVDAETAASFAGLYFIGITAGRAVNGFMTLRFSDRSLVRAGEVLIAVGTLMLFLPAQKVALAGLVLLGIGSAPIYPSIIHSTPAHFGAERSQAIIGVMMASAYVGTCLMPPLFGLIAGYIGAWLLPMYIAALLALMAVMFERLEKKTSKPA